MNDLISQIETWYSQRCSIEGGNHHGFQIHNVAEGGWWIRVDIPATELDHLRSVLKPEERSIDEYPRSWIHYSITDGAFIGACAPALLRELLSAFLRATTEAGRNDG